MIKPVCHDSNKYDIQPYFSSDLNWWHGSRQLLTVEFSIGDLHVAENERETWEHAVLSQSKKNVKKTNNLDRGKKCSAGHH